MSEPQVSVIVPTFNGLTRGYLREALQSVLSQTFRDLELIIVDDGSSDDIATGCAEILQDPRVRLVRQENGGLSAARMTGIEAARGEYVALLDDDDRWAPGKLDAQLDFFRALKDDKMAAMVFTGVRLIDDRGRILGSRVKKACGNMYRKLVLNGNGITAPSAVMFRRAIIFEVGNFDPVMRSLEDFEMWLRISRRYHIYSMPELLTDYRLHGNTITAGSFTREEEYERKLYDRVLKEDPSFSRSLLEGRMLQRFAIRHMSLGNYGRARGFLLESWHVRPSFMTLALLMLLIFPSSLLEFGKKFRRRMRG